MRSKRQNPYFEDLPEDQIDLFFAQGMVYAYIYLQEEKLTEIEVQLTYYQTTEQLITRVRRHLQWKNLLNFIPT